MEGLHVIPANELRHTVTVRHITDSGTQDGFGQYDQVTEDTIEKCHVESGVFQKETKRVKNKEYIVDYDFFLMLLPSANIRQSDQIMKIQTNNGEIVFEDDGGANPMIVNNVVKIPADRGIHHIEASCTFRNPNISV